MGGEQILEDAALERQRLGAEQARIPGCQLLQQRMRARAFDGGHGRRWSGSAGRAGLLRTAALAATAVAARAGRLLRSGRGSGSGGGGRRIGCHGKSQGAGGKA